MFLSHRKNGLRCVSACGDCRGVSCCNVAEERTGIEIDETNNAEFTDVKIDD